MTATQSGDATCEVTVAAASEVRLGDSEGQQPFSRAISPQSWFMAAQHAFCTGVISTARRHVADETAISAIAIVAARSRPAGRMPGTIASTFIFIRQTQTVNFAPTPAAARKPATGSLNDGPDETGPNP